MVRPRPEEGGRETSKEGDAWVLAYRQKRGRPRQSWKGDILMIQVDEISGLERRMIESSGCYASDNVDRRFKTDLYICLLLFMRVQLSVTLYVPTIVLPVPRLHPKLHFSVP